MEPVTPRRETVEQLSGVAHEAEQVSLGRHVAVKVLAKSALLDARQRNRFEREARAAAALHRTNVTWKLQLQHESSDRTGTEGYGGDRFAETMAPAARNADTPSGAAGRTWDSLSPSVMLAGQGRDSSGIARPGAPLPGGW
jgi:hypothetical protein